MDPLMTDNILADCRQLLAFAHAAPLELHARARLEAVRGKVL